MPSKNNKSGFTLIELSIALVIIGLIIGGVLVGQDLINAARARAQVSQIEQYQTAVNTFKLKYSYLPGDIPNPAASGFGFTVAYTDGNGTIGGNNNGLLDRYYTFSVGEANLFWVHLGQSGLISGNFIAVNTNIDTNSSGKVSDYLPPAKLDDNTYVYVWSGGIYPKADGDYGSDGKNYFSVGVVARYCNYNMCGNWGVGTGISTKQAYAIDAKIDDGLPQSGTVQAFYLRGGGFGGYSTAWAGKEDSGIAGKSTGYAPTTAVNTGSADVNCYDNYTNGNPQKYAMDVNGGNNKTCALSFKFQ